MCGGIPTNMYAGGDVEAGVYVDPSSNIVYEAYLNCCFFLFLRQFLTQWSSLTWLKLLSRKSMGFSSLCTGSTSILHYTF